MKILFVCTGNICRSPMAEGLLKLLLVQHGIDDVEVASAGTSAAEGDPASEGGYLVGLECGMDLSRHASRPLTRELVAESDLILGMSEHHVTRAKQLGAGDKAHLLGEFAGKARADAEVPDPFGGDLDDYRVTYRQFAELMPGVIDRIQRGQGSGAGGQNATDPPS